MREAILWLFFLSALCVVRGQDFPSYNTQSFIAKTEVVNHATKTVQRVDYWLDWQGQRLRIDQYRELQQNLDFPQILSTYFFLEKDGPSLRFSVKNFQDCGSIPLTSASASPFLEATDNGLTFKSLDSFLPFLHTFLRPVEYTYVGQKVIRGVLCDHWHATDFWNKTGIDGLGYGSLEVDYFWTNKEWLIQSGQFPAALVGIVPWQVSVYSESGTIGSTFVLSHNYTFNYVIFQKGASSEFAFAFDFPKTMHCRATGSDRLAPSLPLQFTVIVGITNELQRYSTTITEVFDALNSRARIDSFDEEGRPTVKIVSGGFLFEYSNGSCVIKDADEGGVDILQGKLQSEGEILFPFGQNVLSHPAEYQGAVSIHGVDCELYSLSIDQSEDAGSWIYDLNYYFAMEDWEVRSTSQSPDVPIAGSSNSNDTVLRTPIRARATGYFSPADGTGKKYFAHYYDFYRFDVTPPPASAFAIEESWNCRRPGEDGTDDGDGDGDGDGLHPGAWFGIVLALLIIGLILGGCLGVLFTAFRYRRKLFEAKIRMRTMRQAMKLAIHADQGSDFSDSDDDRAALRRKSTPRTTSQDGIERREYTSDEVTTASADSSD